MIEMLAGWSWVTLLGMWFAVAVGIACLFGFFANAGRGDGPMTGTTRDVSPDAARRAARDTRRTRHAIGTSLQDAITKQPH